MRILAFSDLHAHPFKEGKITEDGFNSRLLDCLSALDTIYDYAERKRVDCILFGGDLFHLRKRLDTSAFNEVFGVISEWKITTIMLVGNHDQYDRLGQIHSLEAFKELDHVVVIDEPEWHSLGGSVSVLCLPYIHDGKDFIRIMDEALSEAPANDYKIGLFHVGIDGTKVGQGKYAYTIDSDIALGDLHPDRWDRILSGHYHTPQSIAENVHYIGAPLQHGWADEKENRGFILLDTNTDTLKRLDLDGLPRFVTLPFEELETYGDVINEDDFVRVIFTETPSESALQELKNFGEVTVTVKEERKELNRSGISLGMSKEAILKRYIKLRKEKGIKPGVLLKHGMKYLQ